MKINIVGDAEISGNKIIAPKDLKNVTCDLRGTGNLLVIDKDVSISNTEFQFPSDNALIVVGKYVSIRGKIRAGYKCKIFIGDRTSSTTRIQFFAAENTSITIGDDVMLASNVIIRTEDGHAIYDVNTGARINVSKDVIIGAHVWIAEDSIVLSGAKVGSGTIIGCRSIVKGIIPNNVVAVGAPAKIIKKDAVWERPNVAFFEPWVRNNAIDQNIKKCDYWRKTDDTLDVFVGDSIEKMYNLYQK